MDAESEASTMEELPSITDLTASLTEATAELPSNPPASAEQVLDAARLRHQSARTAMHQLAAITSDRPSAQSTADDASDDASEREGNETASPRELYERVVEEQLDTYRQLHDGLGRRSHYRSFTCGPGSSTSAATSAASSGAANTKEKEKEGRVYGGRSISLLLAGREWCGGRRRQLLGRTAGLGLGLGMSDTSDNTSTSANADVGHGTSAGPGPPSKARAESARSVAELTSANANHASADVPMASGRELCPAVDRSGTDYEAEEEGNGNGNDNNADTDINTSMDIDIDAEESSAKDDNGSATDADALDVDVTFDQSTTELDPTFQLHGQPNATTYRYVPSILNSLPKDPSSSTTTPSNQSSSLFSPSPPPSKTLTAELRRYGEHHCSTHFSWSYLKSTGDALSELHEQFSQRTSHHPSLNPSLQGNGYNGNHHPNQSGIVDPLTASTYPSLPAVSTISLAFSPDGHTLASTHGDHTVKITCCYTGRLVRNLKGHPRTPWTVKYHPRRSGVVASGCLGYQVRVWDWNYRQSRAGAGAGAGAGGGGGVSGGGIGGIGGGGIGGGRSGSPSNSSLGGGTPSITGSTTGGDGPNGYDVLPPKYRPDPTSDRNYHETRGVCLAMIRLQYAIISLSFHPTGHILACASGSKVHLWDWDDVARRERAEWAEEARREMERGAGMGMGNSGGGSVTSARGGHQAVPESPLRDGVARPQQSADSRSRPSPPPHRQPHQQPQLGGRGGEMTEYSYNHALRCVHFPPSGTHIIVGGANAANQRGGGGMSGGGMTFSLRLFEFCLRDALHPLGRPGTKGAGERRKAITKVHVLTDRALLYNDGGFDVSPDGSKMCACVEYWVEDGTEDVNEVLAREIEDVQMEIRALELASGMNEDGDSDEAAESSAHGSSEHSGSMGSPGANGTFSSPPRQGTMGSSSRPARGIPFPLDPKTPPPIAIRSTVPPTPPSPPGRRYSNGTNRRERQAGNAADERANDRPSVNNSETQRPQGASGQSNVMPMPSLSRRHAAAGSRHQRGEGRTSRTSTAANQNPAQQGDMVQSEERSGRWVPHVVTLSLSTTVPSYSPQSTCLLRHQLTREAPLGKIERACRLAGPKASGVTCVKFSPSAEYCLLGYGVRDSTPAGVDASPYHPVAALYGLDDCGEESTMQQQQRSTSSTSNNGRSNLSASNQLVHVATMLSKDDDVNIARFHPSSGYGFVYGTKQGRVRVLGPRPWNYYHA